MRRKSGYSNQRQSTDSSSTREHLLLSGCVQSVFPTQSNLVDRQLVHGYAEIFGAELVEGKAYIFGSECKAAVFTWQGCTIEMSLLTSFRSPFLTVFPNTLLAVLPRSMFQKRLQWGPTATST